METRVQIVLVGGPFDGEKGLWWHADDDHPPPDVIVVGRCAGHGECGLEACPRFAKSHVAYWDREEQWPPIRLSSYVRAATEELATDLEVARYVHDSVDLRCFVEAGAGVTVGV